MRARAAGCAGTRTADGVEAGGHDVGHLGPAGQHEGERARPEARGQGLDARVVGEGARGRGRRRSARWTISGSKDGRALTSKTRATAIGVEGVGAEAVDGLGGEGHEAARAQHGRRLADGRGVGRGQDARAHDGRGAGRRVGLAAPRARGQHAAGGVDVGAAGVAAHEADAVRRRGRRGSGRAPRRWRARSRRRGR